MRLGQRIPASWVKHPPAPTEGQTERLPELAVELVRLKPDVLATAGIAAAIAAQKATTAIPILSINNIDPVGNGLVKSLARRALKARKLRFLTTVHTGCSPHDNGVSLARSNRDSVSGRVSSRMAA